jgi:hypothetical protein
LFSLKKNLYIDRAYIYIFLSREFIAKNYVSLKQANPNFPILIREASGAEARFFARYGMKIK